MKRNVILLTLILIFILEIFYVSAECSEGQIDINSASLEELDKLSGIGPVYAQGIINNRTYDSVDELIKVKGIGPVTLEKIKTQGLACVSYGGAETSKEEKNVTEVKSINEETKEKVVQNVELQKITLNSKDIKTEESNEKTSVETYAFYGLIAFGMLIGFLLLRGKNRENEFRRR